MPLVPPLEQITDAGGLKGPGKWPPLAVVGSDLGSVDGERKLWVRPQKRGDLFRLQFVDVQHTRQHGGVVHLEVVLHGIPVPDLEGRWSLGRRLLRGNARRAAQHSQPNQRSPQSFLHQALPAQASIVPDTALGPIPAGADRFRTCDLACKIFAKMKESNRRFSEGSNFSNCSAAQNLESAISERNDHARQATGGARPARCSAGAAGRGKNGCKGTPLESAASEIVEAGPSRAGGICALEFQRGLLSPPACRMLRLLSGDSSISVRMAMRSSLAEITGKSITSRQPRASRHCRELNVCSARALLELRHSQYAVTASSSHARLSKSSINKGQKGRKHYS